MADKKYLKPWDKSYAQQFTDPRLEVVACGLLAPSGHNMQPWKIKLDDKDGNSFWLYINTDRLTSEIDPFARQATISQGTFLEHVQIAAGKIGFTAEIILFPHGEYDEKGTIKSLQSKPVAKVTLSEKGKEEDSLYEMMFLPHTLRVPYKKTVISQEMVNKLLSLNKDKDLKIRIYQDPENLDKLKGYTLRAAEIEAHIHRISEANSKIFRANEQEKNNHPFGFSLEGWGTSGIMLPIMQSLLTLFPSLNSEKSSADLFIKQTRNALQNTLIFILIISRGNTREIQVKTGMLYSLVQLTVRKAGYAMQPLSQALEEYQEMEEEYRRMYKEYAREGETIQMFARVGIPTKQVPHSLRQDVTDLLF
jgi:hypothetical protein